MYISRNIIKLKNTRIIRFSQVSIVSFIVWEIIYTRNRIYKVPNNASDNIKITRIIIKIFDSQ